MAGASSLDGRTTDAATFLCVCMCSPALFKERASQRQTRLFVLTGAKHRVRSTRGVRGVFNPLQKTPRQRSA